jgi:thiamine biosynthesis lipoprotein
MSNFKIHLSAKEWLEAYQVSTFSHMAMATVFEIFISGQNADYAAQAAQAAFHHLDRLEQELSRFIENSDISRINSLKRDQSTIIGDDAFQCLQACNHFFLETGGAFNISAGPLIKLWKEQNERSGPEFDALIKNATAATGLHRLKLDSQTHEVRLLGDSISLDLGGYGKGYAIDKMADILSEWSISQALLHGGQSSVLALDAPAGETGWPVSITHPDNDGQILERYHLKFKAMNGSGLQKGTHIINPLSGYPVKDTRAAWAMTGSAATGDALSTAFMIMPIDEIRTYISRHPEISALIILDNQDNDEKWLIRLGNKI